MERLKDEWPYCHLHHDFRLAPDPAETAVDHRVAAVAQAG
jgi:hypothetical protein